jgi:hypothetical protein
LVIGGPPAGRTHRTATFRVPTRPPDRRRPTTPACAITDKCHPADHPHATLRPVCLSGSRRRPQRSTGHRCRTPTIRSGTPTMRTATPELSTWGPPEGHTTPKRGAHRPHPGRHPARFSMPRIDHPGSAGHLPRRPLDKCVKQQCRRGFPVLARWPVSPRIRIAARAGTGNGPR